MNDTIESDTSQPPPPTFYEKQILARQWLSRHRTHAILIDKLLNETPLKDLARSLGHHRLARHFPGDLESAR